MNKRQIVAQLLVGLGCLNVLAGAGLHLLAGYPRVSAALAASNLTRLLANAMRAVFLMIGFDMDHDRSPHADRCLYSNANSQTPRAVLRTLAAGRRYPSG